MRKIQKKCEKKITLVKRFFFIFIIFIFYSKNIIYGQDQENIFNSDESVQDNPVYDDFQIKKNREKKKKEKYEKISDLIHSTPFKDVVVIQRRFLPKTRRFEFSGNAILNLQNSLFNNGGGIFYLGYYFNEQTGVELSYSILENSKKELVKRLDKNFNTELERYVKPTRYIGASLKWIPIYGKLSFLNKNIVPFDLFFTLNSGLSYTEKSAGVFSFGLGMGQIFPFNKSSAFRWNLNWETFKPKGKNQHLQENTNNSVGYQNNLFISLGISLFFPGAQYR